MLYNNQNACTCKNKNIQRIKYQIQMSQSGRGPTQSLDRLQKPLMKEDDTYRESMKLENIRMSA